ncbi:hypothetical protein CI238_09364 [Colletotrichum incanum]|uniref:Uncharacterized protein n=1 Tax=Colletotrichum incanum TaxID=1573173 RepID=A0A167EGT8_COLIC|nr:hypothetical protein CI238_09364 [Colletotrichum incanum]
MMETFFRNVQPPLTKTPKGADTCGFMPFPVTTLRFALGEAFPLRCMDSETECRSSGSYKGNASLVNCVGESNIPGASGPRTLTAVGSGPEPYTACWTWLSAEDIRTFTLFYCNTVSGVGTLMADSTTGKLRSGTNPSSTTNMPGTTMDTTAIASSTEIYTTKSGASIITKTRLIVVGPTTETPKGGGEASTGAVVGSIIGALAFVGMVLGAALFVWVRSRKQKKRKALQTDSISPVTEPDGIVMVPYRSDTSVPVPSSYGVRLSRGTGDTTSEAGGGPPRRPTRSPEKKVNVT